MANIKDRVKTMAKNQIAPDVHQAQVEGTAVAQPGTPDNPSDKILTLANFITICRFVLTMAFLVLFVHRPEYYHIYDDGKGNDLHGMAQIIIAKHRKGGTGDVLLNFRGELTRFENPEDTIVSAAPEAGGEFIGSRMNGGTPIPPPMNEGTPF